MRLRVNNLGRWLWVASVALIVWATLLPGNEIAAPLIPPRWCLRCGGLWMTDAISNVVLFAPLGFALAWRGWRWWAAGLAALLFSVGVETSQALGLPPARSAALADVITNTVGGLTGAALATLWGWAVAPSARVAQRLTVAWAAGASAVFWLTAAALGPRRPLEARDTATGAALTRSAYPHVPGQPWFGGILDSAVVEGRYRVRRGWPGPVIVQRSRETATLDAEVFVRGRDIEPFRVPIVYVHLPADSSPLLQLSSNGDQAELSVTRRAWTWGLALPAVRLEQVFAGRTARDPRPLHLVAQVGRDSLRLSATGPGFTGRAALALTPTLGWAMIQTVVDPSSRLAPLFLACWLAGLVLPIGWWGARSGGASWWLPLAGGAAVAATLQLLPRLTGVAPVSAPQWLTLGALLVTGVVGSRLLFRGRLPS